MPTCAYARIYARQRIILAGNHTGSSPPSSVLHGSFSSTFVKHIYIDCRVFDAVLYWPALYLVVGISISYIACKSRQEQGQLVVLRCLA